MTTSQRVSILLLVAGWVAISIGVGWLAGIAWALITAGAFMVAVAVLLYDPADKRKKQR